MKKLMIVGASVLQLPAILKAKEMGLHVAVVDYNPQAIGIPYADEFYNASTMDEEAVCKVAELYQPELLELRKNWGCLVSHMRQRLKLRTNVI